MNKKLIKKLLFTLSVIIVIYLGFSGIFFNGLLLHELIHIVQSPNPQDLCYSIGTKYFMYVSHNISNIEEIKAFQSYSEKWALLGQTYLYWSLVALFSLGLAYLLMYFIERKR